MTKKEAVTGMVHKLPADLQKAIASSAVTKAAWEDITPLARNEWICWVTSGKKAETRGIRIEKAISKLKGGMRRPCCWAGCPHR
jgi:uncharacterized protein YdeI (YjbR/CyaY-like superfamily)